MSEVFHRQEIPLERVYALTKLVSLCEKYNVEISKILVFQHGFSVVFKDMRGDAILHDGSYGRLGCDWETIGMPWDGDDVSVHDAETLVRMLDAVLDGRDWREIEERS